ncbi:unnamed protein product [Phytophthora fragariaefolia]|uniref:Unnamed protein product n=1 Tax=Phytophthora fragariaefolia TaxID=1490495 RepID=A0A9W6XKE3_9STRA|nr:unnamed protein product [Phytophthora fragariaefolia]
MGAATSTELVDCVLDGDIQQLKTLLHEHEVGLENPSGATATKDSAWELQLEEAVHTVVASELESGQQLQQLQIALELLLQARPEAWSSTVSSQAYGGNNGNENAISATSNAAGWSACHRACATGNLAFVTFVLQHCPTQFDLQTRDAFGLFPVDLVPPELLMSTAEIEDNLQQEPDRRKPSTARTRRSFALQNLRERKAILQDQQVRDLMGKPKTEVASAASNQEEETPRIGEFYVAFQPRRERLSIDLDCNLGHVHERGAMLHVNYRLPRTEAFLNGYFQLIWRELGEARSEEPHYDPHITKLRDENARFLDQEVPLQPVQQLSDQEAQTRQIEDKTWSNHRSFDDPSADSVVVGCFPLDVSQLPTDSVCHVLFIACDRHMLHRTIVLSTEGLAVQMADMGDPDSDDYYSDSTSEGDEEEVVEDEQEVKMKQPGYIFFVGGEEFSHPNAVFAGQSFPDVEAFEVFLRELRVKKQRRLQERQEQQEKEAQQEQQKENIDQHQQQQEQQQQQEAGQVAEEVASKSDEGSHGHQREDEVRPVEISTETKENQSNQIDDETEL